MALLREVHPGAVGLADRRKPARRRPVRSFAFAPDGSARDHVPLNGAQEAARQAGSFYFADLQAPTRQELETLQKEFGFHPLALEDVTNRHQRPKIDIYENHYFLVFYRVGFEGDALLLQEIDFFIGQRFLVVTHDSEVPLLDEVFDRFRRGSERKTASRLLYQLLDAIVDGYFPLMDDVAERASGIEDAIFHEFSTSHLEQVLELKRDLARLRRIVGPERDTINVLLRRDPPCIDPADVFYFQDVFDHLVRVTDSIDTYRELLSGSLDAYLSVQNNRLSEIVRKLTVISVTFLPLTFITGFFGMNFRVFERFNHVLFGVSLALMVVVPVLLLSFLRRKGIE